MTAAAIARIADKLLPVQGSFRAGRFIARATCASCDVHEEWTSMAMPRPDVVKKKLAQRGWQIDRRCICPSCTSKSTKEMTTMKPIPAPTAKPQPPFDAKAALRLLSRVLDDEAYDHANQRYKAGFTDESLAKDTGLSAKVVAAERERLCGPIGEPAEIAALREDVARAVRTATLAKAEVDQVALKLSDTLKKHGFVTG